MNSNIIISTNSAIFQFIASILVFYSSSRITSCFKPRRRELDFSGENNNDEFSTDLVPYVAKQDLSQGEASPQVPFYHERIPYNASLHRAKAYLKLQNQRRTVRFFSQDDIPLDLLLACVETGGTAPSGAHQQPWKFNVVRNSNLKQQIRKLVEQEEQQNYDKRMSSSW